MVSEKSKDSSFVCLVFYTIQLLNEHLYKVNSLIDWEKRVGKIRKEEKWILQLLSEHLLRSKFTKPFSR